MKVTKITFTDMEGNTTVTEKNYQTGEVLRREINNVLVYDKNDLPDMLTIGRFIQAVLPATRKIERYLKDKYYSLEESQLIKNNDDEYIRGGDVIGQIMEAINHIINDKIEYNRSNKLISNNVEYFIKHDLGLVRYLAEQGCINMIEKQNSKKNIFNNEEVHHYDNPKSSLHLVAEDDNINMIEEGEFYMEQASKLTKKEVELLSYILKNKGYIPTNKEIGEHLKVSPQRVRILRQNIANKLNKWND